MMKITVICQEEGYPDILIYAVNVRDPNNKAEVEDAINLERQRDLGDEDARPVTALFAFQGDLEPRADWRE